MGIEFRDGVFELSIVPMSDSPVLTKRIETFPLEADNQIMGQKMTVRAVLLQDNLDLTAGSALWKSWQVHRGQRPAQSVDRTCCPATLVLQEKSGRVF